MSDEDRPSQQFRDMIVRRLAEEINANRPSSNLPPTGKAREIEEYVFQTYRSKDNYVLMITKVIDAINCNPTCFSALGILHASHYSGYGNNVVNSDGTAPQMPQADNDDESPATPTEEDWPSQQFRDLIVRQLEPVLAHNRLYVPKLPVPGNAHKIEEYIFQKSISKDQYMRTLKKIIGCLEAVSKNTVAQPSAPNEQGLVEAGVESAQKPPLPQQVEPKTTHFTCVFGNFNLIASADRNPTKWIASKPFSLADYPDVQFCLMYRPTSNTHYSGIYLEPLDLGPYEAVSVQFSIGIQDKHSKAERDGKKMPTFSRSTKWTFNSKSFEGQGWPQFLTAAKREFFITNNTLIVECSIDVLEVTLNAQRHNDRSTHYTWSLDLAEVRKKPRADARFAFQSPEFALTSASDLRLRIGFEHEGSSRGFCQVRLAPTADSPAAHVNMSYMLWIEDKHTGIRLPTWVKNFQYDFADKQGRRDSRFVTAKQLLHPNSIFVADDDTLRIHCKIYHDASSVRYTAANERVNVDDDAASVATAIERDDDDAVSVATAIERDDDDDAVSVATALERDDDEDDALSVATAIEGDDDEDAAKMLADLMASDPEFARHVEDEIRAEQSDDDDRCSVRTAVECEEGEEAETTGRLARYEHGSKQEQELRELLLHNAKVMRAEKEKSERERLAQLMRWDQAVLRPKDQNPKLLARMAEMRESEKATPCAAHCPQICLETMVTGIRLRHSSKQFSSACTSSRSNAAAQQRIKTQEEMQSLILRQLKQQKAKPPQSPFNMQALADEIRTLDQRRVVDPEHEFKIWEQADDASDDDVDAEAYARICASLFVTLKEAGMLKKGKPVDGGELSTSRAFSATPESFEKAAVSRQEASLDEANPSNRKELPAWMTQSADDLNDGEPSNGKDVSDADSSDESASSNSSLASSFDQLSLTSKLSMDSDESVDAPPHEPFKFALNEAAEPLNTATICTALKWALTRDLDALVDEAMEFAAQHYVEIRDTQEWRDFFFESDHMSAVIKRMVERVHQQKYSK